MYEINKKDQGGQDEKARYFNCNRFSQYIFS